jgi:tetratricopeptide (TPR) repeat protein
MTWRQIVRRKESVAIVLAMIVLIGALLSRPEIRARILHPGSTVIRGPKGLPAYVGRDPREWRPVAEEIRIFNDDQVRELQKQLNDWANAILANSDQLEPWIGIGLIKKNIGDYEGAREAWEYVSLIRPKNVVSFYDLGGLYWHELPDFPRAEASYRRAILNEPRYIDSYIGLSDLYRYSMPGKAGEADKPLLEGLEKNPDDSSLLRYLIGYYEQTGQPDKAEEWQKKLDQLK